MTPNDRLKKLLPWLAVEAVLLPLAAVAWLYWPCDGQCPATTNEEHPVYESTGLIKPWASHPEAVVSETDPAMMVMPAPPEVPPLPALANDLLPDAVGNLPGMATMPNPGSALGPEGMPGAMIPGMPQLPGTPAMPMQPVDLPTGLTPALPVMPQH